MSRVEESIDVDVPVRVVYEQWASFEDFPQFMEGVEEVRQLDDRRAYWRVRIAGLLREFETEIVERAPDERVAWRTTGETVKHSGTVDFESLDTSRTRVRMVMVFQPNGLAEKAADKLGVLDRQVRGDLRRFKEFIEDHGVEGGPRPTSDSA
ncbi:SRPBCC family protein [Streptomyces sp. BE20]|uniref:SRPBCC family protein n=1 Tax=Streptomyces sp. BE20 TaxID=3002525 RepID=UPI002E75E922|nr:SRPBCC family protein [Streptomyces sp. BE20]MEE1827606.1 SRPBCC family protein [Streptomyces sp. BE20]